MVQCNKHDSSGTSIITISFFPWLIKKPQGPLLNHTSLKHLWSWSRWLPQTMVARERPMCKVYSPLSEGHRWIMPPSYWQMSPGVVTSSQSARLWRSPVFGGAGVSTEAVPTSQQKPKGMALSHGPVILRTCIVLRGVRGHGLVRENILVLKLLTWVVIRVCLGIRRPVTALSLESHLNTRVTFEHLSHTWTLKSHLSHIWTLQVMVCVFSFRYSLMSFVLWSTRHRKHFSLIRSSFKNLCKILFSIHCIFPFWYLNNLSFWYSLSFTFVTWM